MIVNYYRAFDKEICQMDFVVHAEFEGDYRDEVESMGARVYLLKRPGEVGALRYIRQLADTILAHGPFDAVHIHTNYQAFLAVIAAQRAGIGNIIVHSHTCRFKKYQLIINRLIFKRYRTKNAACGEAAGTAFFGRMPYVVLNNAIDAEKYIHADSAYAKKLREGKYGQTRLIGHLGRFTPPKNHEFLIAVVVELLKYRRDFKLLLYGSGEMEEAVRSRVRREGVEEFVEFCGVTKDPALAYKLMDLFVLPSLWEGFPVTLVESQASGVYSLASEKISRECDLHIGRLEYLALDERLWAQRIDNLLKDTGTVGGVNGNLDDYDVKVQWKRLLDLYRQCD